MHFFQKQKVDAAGYLGVALQKSVIFLMIVTAFAGLGSGSFFSTLLGVGFLFIAFWGAYKRRTCLLAIYFWVNVIGAAIGIVAAVVVIMATPVSMDNDNAGSMSAESSTISHHSIQKLVSSFVNPPVIPNNATNSNPVHPTPYNPNNTITYDSTSAEYQTGVSIGGLVVISFVAVVFAVLVLFFKVYSVVLAWKMRKLLIATRPCTPAPVSAPASEDTKPLLNPGYPASGSVNNDVSLSVFPDQSAQQQQAPMMYMPYPYGFNPMQGQVQYPMVFNQNGQPVFYSYQPMAPQGAPQL